MFRVRCQFRIIPAWIFLVFAVHCLIPGPVEARIVEDVKVRSRLTGYEIKFKFVLPLRYLSHSPKRKGKSLVVQLRPVSGFTLENQELVDQLGDRETLSWDKSVPVPLIELLYEGDNPDRPILTIRFTHVVEFDVRNSADLRNLIITIKTDKKAERVLEPEPERIPEVRKLDPGMPRPDTSSADPKQAKLMEDAGEAMTKGDYAYAIQLYTKILRDKDSVLARDAQELLGLARERNGQLAHGKAEYEEYIRLYPKGPGTDRVRQRLAGLLTAAAKPRQKLRAAKGGALDESIWDTRIFGAFSQFYNHDVSEPENGDSITNRSALTNNLDFNSRWRSDRYDIRTQFVGGYEEDFREGGSGSETRVNFMSVEARDLEKGVYGRVGRQSRHSGGILGRFDGAVASYELNPKLNINGAFGYPVDSTTDKAVDMTKHFFGLSLDLGTYEDRWDFNTFFINQRVDGITDRRAIGGEARYFEPTRSFFSLLDFDVSYTELNIFLFSGNWDVLERTRLNLVLDYRKSPLLTSSNALQGQGLEKVSDLLNIFSEDEVRQLARDRTARSKSATFGVTQGLNENYQVVAEMTISNLSGTIASGGVDSNNGTGNEFFYLAQVIGSNLFVEGDVTIIGLRYADTQNNDSVTFNLNSRFPLNRDFRINPRLQLNYRKNKNNDGDRLTVRPLVRLDYRVKKWLRLEVEAGREFTEEKFFGQTEKSTGYFFLVGYRAEF